MFPGPFFRLSSSKRKHLHSIEHTGGSIGELRMLVLATQMPLTVPKGTAAFADL